MCILRRIRRIWKEIKAFQSETAQWISSISATGIQVYELYRTNVSLQDFHPVFVLWKYAGERKKKARGDALYGSE